MFSKSDFKSSQRCLTEIRLIGSDIAGTKQGWNKDRNGEDQQCHPER